MSAVNEIPTSSRTPAEPSNWRYLWDSNRVMNDEEPINVLQQLEFHAQPLPSDFQVVSAEEFEGGRDAFLSAAGDLLRGNYVQDRGFRFCLHNDFINWAIDTPLCDSNLLVGITIRGEEKQLVALIIGVPLFLHHQDLGFTLAEVQDDDDDANVKPNSAMIDFVCVAQQHRGKRLCPFLYAEITKRCCEKGIQHCICTSGDDLQSPFASSDYWHFPNAKHVPKLCEIGFCPPKWTPEQRQRYQNRIRIRPEVVEETEISLRPMKLSDVSAIRIAYNSHVAQNYKIALQFPRDKDFAHTFLPRPDVIETLVVVNTDDHGSNHHTNIATTNRDFVSFYTNDTAIETGNRKGEMFRQAYVYYCVSTGVPRQDLLLAGVFWLFQNRPEIDTINCLAEVMGNDVETLTNLGFNQGDGDLKYYQFNGPPGTVAAKDVAWLTA